MDYQIFAIIIVVCIMGYVIFVRPSFIKVNKETGKAKLSKDQINFLDDVCVQGMKYAQELYESDEIDVDKRREIAINFVFNVIKEAEIISEDDLEVAQKITEDKLAKTIK